MSILVPIAYATLKQVLTPNPNLHPNLGFQLIVNIEQAICNLICKASIVFLLAVQKESIMLREIANWYLYVLS